MYTENIDTKISKMFFELCRLCLDRTGEKIIHEAEGLADDIFLFTGLTISPTDNFPQKICAMCHDLIDKMKSLRIQAIKNDENLHLLFDERANEPSKLKLISIDPVIANTPSVSIKKEVNDTKNNEVKSKSSNSNSKPPLVKVRNDIFKDSHKTQRSKSETHRTHSGTHRTHSDANSTKEAHNNIELSNEIEMRIMDQKLDAINVNEKNYRIKTENGAEFYKCDQCSKLFTVYKKFYCHQRQHKKSVICPFDGCSKMFSTKNDLRKHVRTHTGEKPYVCDLCNRGFTQNVTLKIHIADVHNQIV